MSDSPTRCPSCAAAITQPAAKCQWCGTLLPAGTFAASATSNSAPRAGRLDLPRDLSDFDVPPARRSRGIGGVLFGVLLIGAIFVALSFVVFSLRSEGPPTATPAIEQPHDLTPSHPPQGR
jgi:hypothetical protein